MQRHKSPNGKIFFYDPIVGGYRYCSGSAINSGSKRIVATAAHCIHEETSNTWYYNVYFYPDYFEGLAPHGGFPAVVYWVLPEWVNQENFYHGNNSDVAFLTTDTNYQDLRVVEVVGGHGITHGGGYSFQAKIFGYPRILSNGEVMYNCSGITTQRSQSGYNFVSSNWCNFSQGASGGPWLSQYNSMTRKGVLRGISSWISCRNPSEPCDDVRHLNSPYFSNSIINLFNNANSADW